MVLTQGMPWYFFRMRSSCFTDDAMSVSRKLLKIRKLSTLASRMANASWLVHGSGMPRIDVKIGPFLVHQRVCDTCESLPSSPLTVTVTLRCSIGVISPSNMYDVGSPGANVSW